MLLLILLVNILYWKWNEDVSALFKEKIIRIISDYTCVQKYGSAA